eukprot:scaffold145650_cov36-Tisochrysis_lutea.AAC.4
MAWRNSRIALPHLYDACTTPQLQFYKYEKQCKARLSFTPTKSFGQRGQLYSTFGVSKVFGEKCGGQ